jgi:tripartite-type tricarboxylate transporter receptor subunit TctC
MKPTLHRIVASALLGAFFWLPSPVNAQAPAWPAKTIYMVMGYGAGSGADVEARLFAPFLSSALGVPVIVDGRPGAGGIIGAEHAAKQPPDGYTLFLSTAGITTFSALNKDLKFDPQRDFDPVTQLNDTSSGLLVASKEVPAKNLVEFVAYAKANPGKVNYASAGRNTILLVMESLKQMANVQMTEVPYAGQGAYLTALARNDVQLAMASPSAAKPLIDAGQFKAVVTLGPQRLAILPDTPTAIEMGYPGLRSSGWYGVLAPHGTPAAIQERVAAEAKKFAATPAQQDRAQKGGFTWVASTPAQFRDAIATETKFWADVAKRAGIKPE